jgi:hypothetical protein
MNTWQLPHKVGTGKPWVSSTYRRRDLREPVIFRAWSYRIVN